MYITQADVMGDIILKIYNSFILFFYIILNKLLEWSFVFYEYPFYEGERWKDYSTMSVCLRLWTCLSIRLSANQSVFDTEVSRFSPSNEKKLIKDTKLLFCMPDLHFVYKGIISDAWIKKLKVSLLFGRGSYIDLICLIFSLL